MHSLYNVAIPLVHPGWVGKFLGCSTILLEQYVAKLPAYQPGELLILKSTQPRFRPGISTMYINITTCVCYIFQTIVKSDDEDDEAAAAAVGSTKKGSSSVPNLFPDFPIKQEPREDAIQ